MNFRNPGGDLIHFPLVETRQFKGICHEVLGPVTNEALIKEAKSYAQSLSGLFPDLPLFALEFFLTGDNNLYMNELAPRVHNSAHYSTLERTKHGSQFHNWMRVVAGHQAIDWTGEQTFVMRNLLGQEGSKLGPGPLKKTPELLKWYGKANRPGRKLGHWNSWVESERSFAIALETLKKQEKDFWKEQL
jgi:5-(carboxyamino)imidazole ribonucleotide synthase